jgi:hypothetical protein
VTLLLLLASIAVLEYVLRRPDPARRLNTKTTSRQEAQATGDGQSGNGNPTLAPALFQLGRAVEQFGRGPVPQPAPPKPVPQDSVPKVPKT